MQLSLNLVLRIRFSEVLIYKMFTQNMLYVIDWSLFYGYVSHTAHALFCVSQMDQYMFKTINPSL